MREDKLSDLSMQLSVDVILSLEENGECQIYSVIHCYAYDLDA